MENFPAVNIFCELWPFGTYDPHKRQLLDAFIGERFKLKDI